MSWGLGSAGAGSLRRTWTGTVAKFVALLVAVTVVAVIASKYQRSVFAESMSALEEQTAASARLDRAMLEATLPLSEVIYRIGSPAQQEESRADYDVSAEAVEARFEQMEGLLHTAAERDALADARQTWGGIDAVVANGGEMYSDEELFGLISRGEDPYGPSVWEPFEDIDTRLTDMRLAMVADGQDRVGELDDVERSVLGLLLAGLAIALTMALFTVRGMSRKVLDPLAQIAEGARAMRNQDSKVLIEAPGAVAEIRDVASALTETAMSLDLTHGMLEEQAITDALTALPNRTAFYGRLAGMVQDPAVGRVAVMFIDLDDFKDVNDTLGHAAGDKLLHVVGLRLQAATRGCEMVARLGGDEFAVALDVGDDTDRASIAAQRVLDTMATPVHLGETATNVGCSIGIAFADPDATEEEVPALLANADFAMYMAKSQGKNRYELHSPEMHLEMLARMELRRDLTEALDRDQFELYYQPIMDLDTEKLLGFEALLRWNHPIHGLIPPGEFISMAEDLGAIVDIGAWVLDTACAQLTQLHLDDPELMMSINIAPQQITAPGFTRSVLNAVLGHGIHVALDDFGTGFSSLRYLSDLPADVVKIDRSFVAGRSDDAASMLDSIITLAQRLGLRVVAEGIEMRDDLDRLRDYGHVAGQGFLFARPMPAHDIQRFRAALHETDHRPMRSV